MKTLALILWFIGAAVSLILCALSLAPASAIAAIFVSVYWLGMLATMIPAPQNRTSRHF